MSNYSYVTAGRLTPRESAVLLVEQADLIEAAVRYAPAGPICVVNPANSHLRHGSGCAGSLALAAGPDLQSWSDQSILDEGPVSVGHCRMGPGFGLNARVAHVVGLDSGSARVAHVVGPRVVNRAVTLKDQQNLANCVREAILQAEFEELRTVLLPAVSSGLFGFPKNLCASILVQVALSLAPRLESVKQIVFVNHDEFTTALFKRALEDARGGQWGG